MIGDGDGDGDDDGDVDVRLTYASSLTMWNLSKRGSC